MMSTISRAHTGTRRVNPRKTASRTVTELIAAANRKGEGQGAIFVSRLVGAYLAVRFGRPELVSPNHIEFLGEAEESSVYLIGDTEIHVARQPGERLMKRCRTGIEQGFRVFILVSTPTVVAAQQLAESEGIDDRVSVSGIEDYVGTGVEDLAVFSGARVRVVFKELLSALAASRVLSTSPHVSIKAR